MLSQSKLSSSLFEGVSLPGGYRITELSPSLDAELLDLRCGELLDDLGEPFRFSSVTLAARELDAVNSESHYPGPVGHREFLRESEKLIFGASHPSIVSCQSIGGSGGLSLLATTLHRVLGAKTVLIDDLSWAEHARIFGAVGYSIERYSYLDSGKKFNLYATADAIGRAEVGDVIVLQPCAHNPTGISPTSEEWHIVLDQCKARGVFPIFDLAYLGLSGDLSRDLSAIEIANDLGLEFGVVTSFCKITGLYGHRIGSVSVKINDLAAAPIVQEQLKITVRESYSSPSIFPARIVERILATQDLKNFWLEDLTRISSQITARRFALDNRLLEYGVHLGLASQSGIFAWTGLDRSQVGRLRREHGISLPSNGRISLGRLSSSQIERVAHALAVVLRESRIT